MKEKIVRETKLAVLEIIQGDEVLFSGNTNEIKKYFEIDQKKINSWRGKGISVQRGRVPKPTTIYAKFIGHKYGIVESTRNTSNVSKFMISEIEEEKLRETETKEERQLRRQTKRKIMMENLRKEYFNG
ncbi:hypothetical protein [Lactococcus formosensis]|uniref:DUF658 domain-containing protein n=1 Tax=Lactococcus formosensis TaxID=1281486 RepID=A0A9X4SDI3_9LACT|nr:hypothetical protein [Lactococcus formosensis]MDG6126426.1 hypothetical protein [Lactococcus formosensis]MDG6131886.1 hypothetical protein [Lactococcus formosensis]MDG6133883.1 hypothetical protein [Lactococcus formosensis]MDG6140491.1 hypothetical protein [Lactococcus formosensis]MDG6145033.1 hypothetical protein [Lactococcus formosensis]